MSMLPGPMAIEPPTSMARELVTDAGDLRKLSVSEGHTGLEQRMYGFQARLNPNVTYEEYTYWAREERQLEEVEFRQWKQSKGGLKGAASGSGIKSMVAGLFRTKAYEDGKTNTLASSSDHKFDEKTGAVVEHDGHISTVAPNSRDALDAEWRTAARALRSATWGGIFYLITTDILGWGQTPYVFANTGYGLGAGIFVLMGIAAGVSGIMIWRVFLKLDSSRYPVLTFGDPFYRLYGSAGPTLRHAVNVLQAVQMFLSVCVVQLGQTYILAQLAASADLCLVVCGIICLVVGMASGYMRSLTHLGWFCNASVWLNVVTFIIICVAAAKYGPDPTAQVSTGILPKEWIKNPAPVVTFVGTPPPEYQPTDANLFAAKFNGINSMVYAYSGAILFIAFLSEMRRPMDFWKAMICAQLFIMIVYIFFGAFTYTYYGQYAYVTITQVVKPLSLQIVGNVLGLITGWLAVFLYFNVGMKTVYLEVGQEIFKLPPITTKNGKYLWWGLGPVYWILAFIVAMSVPQFAAFTNFVGGLFSLNFTYSFSGFMFVAMQIHEGAHQEGEGFNPETGVTVRHDEGFKRYARGFMKRWYFTIPATLYTLAGLASSGMGTWAATEALIAAFGPGGSKATSWSCVNPFAS